MLRFLKNRSEIWAPSTIDIKISMQVEDVFLILLRLDAKSALCLNTSTNICV